MLKILASVLSRPERWLTGCVGGWFFNTGLNSRDTVKLQHKNDIERSSSWELLEALGSSWKLLGAWGAEHGPPPHSLSGDRLCLLPGGPGLGEFLQIFLDFFFFFSSNRQSDILC